MFCPECGAEYRDGFTRCSDCDVDLVPALKSSKAHETAGPVLAWRGDDPILFSRVVAALKEGKILYFPLSDHNQLPIQPTTPRPGYGIFVKSEDVQRVENIVREVLESDAPESGSRGNG